MAMTDDRASSSTGCDDMTKQIIVKAYALFCVEHKMPASVEAAQAFAVKVTEGSGKKYHDMTSDDLVRMLDAPGALEV
jgi:hypothetical protein